MKASEIIKILDALAPRFLIDSWDNSGLQIGNKKRDIEKILVTLDLSKECLETAVKENVDMIVSHHPFLFKEFKKISLEDGLGEMIEMVIKNDILVFSMHTNLDMCIGGVNDVLSDLLDIENTIPLSEFKRESLYKVSVFVPEEYTDDVKDALGRSGAGFIGNYSHCTFSTSGIGEFLPHENTNPFIGTSGVVERVREDKIETIVDEYKLERVLAEMIAVHPYEEVAYDVYPLKNKGKVYGYGRVGNLRNDTSLKDFSKLTKSLLKCESVRTYGDLNRLVRRVAVCGGSGACFIEDAVKMKADVYVTGDIKYHDAQKALELGICLIDAGHFETEVPVLDVLKEYLIRETKLEVITHEENLLKHNIL